MYEGDHLTLLNIYRAFVNVSSPSLYHRTGNLQIALFINALKIKCKGKLLQLIAQIYTPYYILYTTYSTLHTLYRSENLNHCINLVSSQFIKLC